MQANRDPFGSHASSKEPLDGRQTPAKLAKQRLEWNSVLRHARIGARLNSGEIVLEQKFVEFG